MPFKCRNNRMIIDICFSARNYMSGLPSLDITSCLFKGESWGEKTPTLAQDAFNLSAKHEDEKGIWKESEETGHSMLKLR